MINTRRRINIAQAFRISGQYWCTMETLQSCGAYGTRTSIHRAIRKMIQHDAASILNVKTGPLYRITPDGFAKLKMVPAKVEA